MNLNDLSNALQNDSLIYYYQPKVSMITGDICGAEALLRWIEPNGNIINPAEFIPLAEKSGFIKEITLSMFNKMIVDFNIIKDFNDSIVLSFNASPVDFGDDRLIEAIKQAVHNNLIPANKLEVEITESATICDDEDLKRRILSIEEMGVGLAMDDFGTGYSSIDTLSKWPFTTIKIDQGVVGRISHSDKDLTIAEASIRMAHELELNIVAEGIETEEVYNILLSAGCTICQGYWVSRPLPIHKFIDFINTEKRWPADLIGLIYQAQLDHMKWRKSIIDGVYSLNDRKTPSPFLRGKPEIDHTKCMLGKWYYGVGRASSEIELYKQLEEPHILLHRLGEQILISAKNGASKSELMLLIRELTEQSILLVGILQEIENELRVNFSKKHLA